MANRVRLPRKEAQRRPHEFSRIIVCAACRRFLRVGHGKNGLPYYRDTSLERKLPCPTVGNLTVRSSLVFMQFGEILRSVELPDTWREMIAELCTASANEGDDEHKRIRKRREELDAQQKRLNSLFVKGYLSEKELDEQMSELQSERFKLPILEVKDAQKTVQDALSAGETLISMADYWSEAAPEERRSMVWRLLKQEGLVYDLERHAIVGLLPNANMLPVLALGLEATGMWEQREGCLWLREDYWPPKRDEKPGREPILTPAEQERAIALIRQGMSLRKVAEHFDISYEAIRRLTKRQGIELRRGERRLTPNQLEQAYELLKADAPLREVARQFGIHPESLRRLARRDGVPLRAKAEKLTPTQRKLTPERQQEARALVQSGVSIRQTAKQLGISRSALQGLLKSKGA